MPQKTGTRKLQMTGIMTFIYGYINFGFRLSKF